MIKEEFVNFLWKYSLLNKTHLTTTKGLPLQILHPGSENKNAGPDFSAAKIRMDNTVWAGNVEVHIKSSDWYRHGHQHDRAYDNIILHVVFEHDQEITDNHHNEVPVLEVKGFFNSDLLNSYQKIISSRSWIPCAASINESDPVITLNWLNRMLVERMENKADEIIKFWSYFENNWEQTFYYFLARNFGFKTNASPFALLAQRTPFLILAKHKNNLTQLEAILFGQSGMLNSEFKEAYPTLLQKEYSFLKHKYDLQSIDPALWKFGKLRPPNFPTLRIAQFARLIHQSSGLFSKLMSVKNIQQTAEYFQLNCSPYWNNHYRFDNASRHKEKKIGISAIHNIMINTITPIMFVYGTQSLNQEIRDRALALLSEIPPEDNTIIRNWKKIGVQPQNAGDTQAMIQLKKYYCTPRKCLSCAIGLNLIKKA